MLAALLLAASPACSDSSPDKASPTATVATEPAPTTTTDPYAVPAVIDAAYVNQVLAGLDRVMGDVTRLVVRTRTIPPEAYDRLRALYPDDERLQRSIDSFQRDLRQNLSGYRADPGDKASTVTQLITATPACIFTQVERDYSNVGTTPLSALNAQWIGLKPLDTKRDPSGYNLAKWVFVYEGFPPDRSQPPNPCAS